jgi:integrase
LPDCLARTNALIDEARKVAQGVALQACCQPTAEQLASSHAISDQMQRDGLDAAEFFFRQDNEEAARAETDADFAQNLELRTARGLEIRRLREVEEDRELARQLWAERKVGLLDLFDKYAAIPGRSPKTIAQWRPYISRLVAFLGDDNALAVTHDKLTAWRNHLRDEVKHKGKPLSAKTINGSYLGAVGALLVWAKGDGLISINPMLEVTKVQLPKQPTFRGKEFTSEEAKLILRATRHSSASREGQELKDAKRWVPWLMAYSGARVNEITQLRSEDIFEQDGVWAMRLTPDAGTIKAKSLRLVPLHRHLIEQGFLEFATLRSSGPLFYNPARRRSDNAINRQANRLGSKLASWVRSLGIEGVKPNHAWRHLFNTLAVRHEIDQRSTFAILGHSSGNVNQQYGSVQVDVLARELNKLPPFET